MASLSFGLYRCNILAWGLKQLQHSIPSEMFYSTPDAKDCGPLQGIASSPEWVQISPCLQCHQSSGSTLTWHCLPPPCEAQASLSFGPSTCSSKHLGHPVPCEVFSSAPHKISDGQPVHGVSRADVVCFFLTRGLACGSLHDNQLAQGPVIQMPCSLREIVPCLPATNLLPNVFPARLALLRRKCGSTEPLFDHVHAHLRSIGEVKGAMRCLPASDLLLFDAQDRHAGMPQASLQCFGVSVPRARVGSLAVAIPQQ